jgi:hypothetical protein
MPSLSAVIRLKVEVVRRLVEDQHFAPERITWREAAILFAAG